MNPAELLGAKGKGRTGRETKQTQTQLPKTKLERGHLEAAVLAEIWGGGSSWHNGIFRLGTGWAGWLIVWHHTHNYCLTSPVPFNRLDLGWNRNCTQRVLHQVFLHEQDGYLGSSIIGVILHYSKYTLEMSPVPNNELIANFSSRHHLCGNHEIHWDLSSVYSRYIHGHCHSVVCKL